MRADGVDVISLGIGDPDLPTPAAGDRGAAARRRAAGDPPVPVQPGLERLPGGRRGLLRRAASASTLDPETEIIPVLGGKEAVAHVALACLDPGDVAPRARPGLPAVHVGPGVRRARRCTTCRSARRTPSCPTWTRFRPRRPRRGPTSSTSTTRTTRPGPSSTDGFFERAVAFAGEHDLVAIHDSAYTEIAFDGYRPPSFLATPGAKDVGAEIFSLSKGWNMTGWRVGWIAGNAEVVERYRQLKTNLDSGMFDALQLAGVGGAHRGARLPAGDVRDLPAPPRPDDRRPRGDRDRRRSHRAPPRTSGSACPTATTRRASRSSCSSRRP